MRHEAYHLSLQQVVAEHAFRGCAIIPYLGSDLKVLCMPQVIAEHGWLAGAGLTAWRSPMAVGAMTWAAQETVGFIAAGTSGSITNFNHLRAVVKDTVLRARFSAVDTARVDTALEVMRGTYHSAVQQQRTQFNFQNLPLPEDVAAAESPGTAADGVDGPADTEGLAGAAATTRDDAAGAQPTDDISHGHAAIHKITLLRLRKLHW